MRARLEEFQHEVKKLRKERSPRSDAKLRTQRYVVIADAHPDENRHVAATGKILNLQESIKRNRAVAVGLSELKVKQRSLECRVNRLEDVRPTFAVINTLQSDEIVVLKPICISVEYSEDDAYVASFSDAGISSGGDTVDEAIDSLRDAIRGVFRSVVDLKDDQLGPKMLLKRNALLEFLCRSQKTTQKS